jgi:sn-glycerol 3-phosphate transport system ATP-binding protein
MAGVTLNAVRKVYAGAIEAVKGVSLEVEDGSFCVLVGPSGCGKSTLLRMIAGLETITGGEIAIGGRVVNALEPAERDIAMVFQNYALYPHMRVYDNMAYGLRNRGTPKAEIEARVREAARILDIEPFLQRRPRELSGGQRQRVAMGRAIVRKPQVFLFDEPLSNLDAKLRVQMRVEIKRLQRQLGVTSVYVTHDQVEAMTLSDKLVVMNAGRIEQVGTPTQVYRRPATRFVATFIGSPPMNLAAGVVEGTGAVAIGGRTLRAAEAQGLRPGTAVEVGMRPEDLRVEGEGLPFVLEFVEELGATQLLHGKVGGSGVVVQAPTGSVRMEGALALAIEPSAVHLFDPETGRRLGPERVAQAA